MKEIEIKIKLTETQQTNLEKWLKNNADFVEQTTQLEYYLDNPSQTFLFQHVQGYKDAADYLRVRFDSENGGSVCLKRFEIDMESGTSKNIGEYEYNVDDPQMTLRQFEELGYRDQTKVNKSRRKWVTNEVEIVIDEVENLGSFAEFELIDSNAEYHEGIKILNQFIRKLGFTEIDTCSRGYVSMLWNPSYNFVKVKNLT